ncbi:MAG: hypothetical protein ACRERE_35790 [Candidatus Entotheonellia bacterium]
MRKWLLALLIFVVLAGLRTFPLLLHLHTHVPSEPVEPLLVTWILAWDVHALTTDPSHFFDANIFYPIKRALAFSEHLLGVQPIFAPIALVTDNPIFAYNALFILSFALSGFAMFVLVFYWTGAFWPSIVAGTLFAFAPCRFAQIGHLQLLNFFWAPLALMFLDRFLRAQRWLDLLLLALFYWLQVLSSVYLGYMITIAVALYVGYYVLLVDRTLLRLPMLPKVLTFLGGSLLILLPVHLPYLTVAREWDISRILDAQIYTEAYVYLSAEVLNYLSVPPFMAKIYHAAIRTFLPVAESVGVNEKWLFPGLVMPVLALLGSLCRLESIDPQRVKVIRRICWLVMGVAFLLSLGPFLVMLRRQTEVPMPYLLFFQVIPGFRVIRAPARFALLVVLVASPLAALGALKLVEVCRRLGNARPIAKAMPALVALALMALALLELGLQPLPLARIPTREEIPEVYRWLAAEQPGPIVEVPLGILQDFEYLYYSTSHWLPLVNGVSGYIPPTFQELKNMIERLPSAAAVDHLKALGVSAVVLHTDRLRPAELERWHAVQAAEKSLQEVRRLGPAMLYHVPSVPSSAGLRLQIDAPAWLPAQTRMTLRLALRAEPAKAWRHPAPHESSPYTQSDALVEWKTSGGTKIVTNTRVRLPLVIPPEAHVFVPVAIETPQIHGTYTLRLSIPSLMVEAESRPLDIRDTPLPSSLSAPHLLSATYHLLIEQPSPSMSRAEPLPLTLRAQNTGQAVWLAEAHEDRGAVRLGWRWFKADQPVPGSEGRSMLPYDVFPGQSYEFKVSIDPPGGSGLYTLQVGLVSERVAWFSDLDVPPTQLTMEIDQTPPCESFDRLLEKSDTTPTDSPRFHLSTDRPRYHPRNGIVHLFLKLEHVPEPFMADIYLVLRGPDCRIYFFEYDRNPIVYHGALWPIFWRGVSLQPASDQPHIHLHAFSVGGFASGSYSMSILFTEPNSDRIITQARTTFQVQL